MIVGTLQCGKLALAASRAFATAVFSTRIVWPSTVVGNGK
jgi:hypothetical protein